MKDGNLKYQGTIYYRFGSIQTLRTMEEARHDVVDVDHAEHAAWGLVSYAKYQSWTDSSLT